MRKLHSHKVLNKNNQHKDIVAVNVKPKIGTNRINLNAKKLKEKNKDFWICAQQWV